jgi:hypothetical protein
MRAAQALRSAERGFCRDDVDEARDALGVASDGDHHPLRHLGRVALGERLHADDIAPPRAPAPRGEIEHPPQPGDRPQPLLVHARRRVRLLQVPHRRRPEDSPVPHLF